MDPRKSAYSAQAYMGRYFSLSLNFLLVKRPHLYSYITILLAVKIFRGTYFSVSNVLRSLEATKKQRIYKNALKLKYTTQKHEKFSWDANLAS